MPTALSLGSSSVVDSKKSLTKSQPEEPIIEDLRIRTSEELARATLINVCLRCKDEVIRTEAKVITKPWTRDGQRFIVASIEGSKYEYALSDFNIDTPLNGHE